MRKGYPYTFNYWMTGLSGEVKHLPVEGKEYTSEYVVMFNHLKDRGWKKEGQRWRSPHTGETVGTIKKAYDSQMYREKVLKQ